MTAALAIPDPPQPAVGVDRRTRRGQAMFIHYNRLKIVPLYLFGILAASVCAFPISEGTTLSAMVRPPGIYLTYAVSAVIVAMLLWRLPLFVMAAVGIPAIEYDGDVLLVRGWRDFKMTQNDLAGAHTYIRKGGSIAIETPFRKYPVVIDLRHLSHPHDATRLLQRLTGTDLEK